MGVNPKIGEQPPKSSILIGFSIIFTIHFGVPVFLETPIYSNEFSMIIYTVDICWWRFNPANKPVEIGS